MKKWKKILLLILSCYISYYLVFEILSLTTLSKEVITNTSLIFFILPLMVYFFAIKKVIKKENEEVTKISLKIQKLIELNNSYGFKEISKSKHNIVEREYSRKSLHRVTGPSIIRYHIENNIDMIRTDIENAIYNLNLIEEYNKDVDKISVLESNNESKYSNKKFQKIENRVYNSLIYKKEKFLITLKLEVYYRSNSGDVYDRRQGDYSFNELVDLYNEWTNGNKFEETKKQERKIMNDDIRYNVLKRDNYACKICGATAKDGAKLHVDHIIPVSKGGKTVMSNLQTLCDRCNLGKSNKIDGEVNNDLICPKCGGKLAPRNGKYGRFIGCSNYPKCHYKQ